MAFGPMDVAHGLVLLHVPSHQLHRRCAPRHLESPSPACFLWPRTSPLFFPQLVAGPIVRAGNFCHNSHPGLGFPNKHEDRQHIQRILTGFIKKVLLGDFIRRLARRSCVCRSHGMVLGGDLDCTLRIQPSSVCRLQRIHGHGQRHGRSAWHCTPGKLQSFRTARPHRAIFGAVGTSPLSHGGKTTSTSPWAETGRFSALSAWDVSSVLCRNRLVGRRIGRRALVTSGVHDAG